VKRTKTNHPGIYSYETASGELRFCVRIDGTERTGFRKLSEAKAAQAKERTNTRSASPQLARTTALRDLWEPYLATRVDLRRGTRTQLVRHWTTRIEPAMGTYSLARIDSQLVQNWVGSMAVEGLSASYIINCVGTLRSLLDYACVRGFLTTNPVSSVRLPRKQLRKAERRYLTEEQVQAVASKLSGQPRRAFLTMVFGGMRWGELRGLRVRDLDVQRRRLSINSSVSYLPDGDGWAWHENGTKTHQDRKVALSASLMSVLQEQAEGKRPDDLLFPSQSGDFWREPAKATRGHRKEWLERGLKEAGVSYLSPNELRHTAASLLVSKGVNVLAAARQLGHSPQMLLQTYADLYDSDLDAAAEALESAFPTL